MSKGLNKPILNQIADQAAHFGIAFVFSLIVASNPWLGAFAGFTLGALREITEGGNVLSKGSLLDVLFWTLGGFAGGFV